MVTIFANILSKEPHYITVDEAIERIRSGKSRPKIEEIRTQLDKERANKLKMNLPSVCFSGKFAGDRKDEQIIEHSGFIVLDFDDLADIREKQTDIINHDFVYACWVSPRGNGLKTLVRIADGSKHREHFQALQEVFPELDKSGINESRVCYESWDPEIYVNRDARPFKKFKKYVQVQVAERSDPPDMFQMILKWLANRGDAFVSGERNIFIFKLASACCRFGITEDACLSNIATSFPLDNSFSVSECQRAIKSAYRANKHKYGDAHFEKDILIEKTSRGEVKIDETIFDESIRPKDVIFGEDVKDKAIDIFLHGYEKLKGIESDLDSYYKPKSGEITLLTGIGNYGKSTWLSWYLLCRCLLYNERFALFSPESDPAEEFYNDLVEILLGGNCTPENYDGTPNRDQPTRETYEAAYDWISKRIFFVFPKDIKPTPEYIKERFLELIIKEKVNGVIIDPFNQLENDYGARSDKYLETFLSDCSRFAKINNVFFWIVAHPKLMKKDGDGNYPCPDVFDIADGAMWNNKMDNILVYHRPNHQKDPSSPLCELHSKKIRRQKTVGQKGMIELDYYRKSRRYTIVGSDILQKIINNSKIDFLNKYFGNSRYIVLPNCIDFSEPNYNEEPPF